MIWNKEFIRNMLEKGIDYEKMKEYTKQLIEKLEKEATEDDVHVTLPTEPPEQLKQIAKELGYEYVKVKCSVCGCEVYALNVKTKAKIMCLNCAAKKIENERLLNTLKAFLIAKLNNAAKNPNKPLEETFLKGEFYSRKYKEIVDKMSKEPLANILTNEILKCNDLDEILTILAIMFELALKNWIHKRFILIPKEQIAAIMQMLNFEDEYEGGGGLAF